MENGRKAPLLGMETFFDDLVAPRPQIGAFVAPGPDSQSTTHGGFDEDAVTRGSVIRAIGDSDATTTESQQTRGRDSRG